MLIDDQPYEDTAPAKVKPSRTRVPAVLDARPEFEASGSEARAAQCWTRVFERAAGVGAAISASPSDPRYSSSNATAPAPQTAEPGLPRRPGPRRQYRIEHPGPGNCTPSSPARRAYPAPRRHPAPRPDLRGIRNSNVQQIQQAPRPPPAALPARIVSWPLLGSYPTTRTRTQRQVGPPEWWFTVIEEGATRIAYTSSARKACTRRAPCATASPPSCQMSTHGIRDRRRRGRCRPLQHPE